ncbi:iron complex transport system substrate-binding protein [Sinobaca qinghaiensis]|uniref:Iron complex transport system substrate-binding protein n=1 Tax=Sinobaca qinghaiensis TaxID=342944 RepID=A0A419UW67_9BACL|nr:cobalamin-binding protein [Sinobaca qinghaiensis]RKD68817.1 iron complex transport system substrate-binding protein [Sinobaca qinghaiensis]
MTRIVSLCPSSTETAAYLGLTSNLVGVDSYSDWPAEVNDLPDLGPDLSIDMDAVMELKPDVVLASHSVPGMEKNTQEMDKRGISYVLTSPNTLSDVLEDLMIIGEATGTTEKAEEIIYACRQMMDTYHELASRCEPSRLYWEWWPKPPFTPGGGNWLTEISAMAGAENIFADKEEASVKTTWEEIRERDPDRICLAWVGVPFDKVKPELLKKREGWPSMKAMENGSIDVLPEPLYCRPSPRLFTGLAELAYLLHPDIFPKPLSSDVLLHP